MDVVNIALDKNEVGDPNRLQELAFTRKTDLTTDEYREVRDYLEGLMDEQLTHRYCALRDKSTEFSPDCFYPNIQILFATPFEREKDRREQKYQIETQDGCSVVVAWYREAREKPCVCWLENHVIARHSLNRKENRR